jgi:transcriptional regulator with XRE-family HTH domain
VSSPLISAAQIRAGRHLASLSQADIAKATGLSLPTIKRAESEREVSVSNDAVDAIRGALEAAGVEFTNGKRPGVRMNLLERGHRVRLRHASERHAATLGVRPGEVATVLEWRVPPGDPPWGRIRLRLPSGAITDWLDTSNFERA